MFVARAKMDKYFISSFSVAWLYFIFVVGAIRASKFYYSVLCHSSQSIASVSITVFTMMMCLLLALVLLSSSFQPLHSMLDFSPALFDFEMEKYIVVPVYILGLANRLRTMSSVFSIAKRTNRKLIVVWVPNMDCNIGTC